MTDWARERFVPVQINLPGGQVLLGLLAKLAYESSTGMIEKPLIIVGRHLPPGKIGCDMVLVDPKSKIPLGILPDFTFIGQDSNDRIQGLKLVYGGLILESENSEMALAVEPLGT